MFTEKDRSHLAALLEQKAHDKFLGEVNKFSSSDILEQSVNDLKDEWRKLQIAGRNGLMDEEQIHLAFTAFYGRKSKEMLTLQQIS